MLRVWVWKVTATGPDSSEDERVEKGGERQNKEGPAVPTSAVTFDML